MNEQFKKDLKKHLTVALKEICEIKPWFDPNVKEWIFTHPNYPVRLWGQIPQKVIEKYPQYSS